MESLRIDLIRASNADRALQIIDDNRECLSDEMIRSALASRASKLASRLSSIVARWSGISASAESIAERISDVLNSEYDEQSWQRCWEMGVSLMDSYVVEPIRGKFANEADPIMTFRELPMRLAEYVVEQYREGCIKHELYAKISKLQALALEPIAIQNDGSPTRAVFAESLKRQITSLQIDGQFFERLMNYSTDPTVQRFLSTIVKTTSPQNAEDIIYRLTEDRMTQYDQAVSQFRYTSTCRQITEYLKRPILPSDGNLPDKDLYRDSVSHDIEAFNIDSSFVEELRQNWENRTIRIFDNVACSISRDNVNAYANISVAPDSKIGLGGVFANWSLASMIVTGTAASNITVNFTANNSVLDHQGVTDTDAGGRALSVYIDDVMLIDVTELSSKLGLSGDALKNRLDGTNCGATDWDCQNHKLEYFDNKYSYELD